jgi:hypothetical protein
MATSRLILMTSLYLGAFVGVAYLSCAFGTRNLLVALLGSVSFAEQCHEVVGRVR